MEQKLVQRCETEVVADACNASYEVVGGVSVITGTYSVQFSPNWPTGPIRSSSRDVHIYIYISMSLEQVLLNFRSIGPLGRCFL